MAPLFFVAPCPCVARCAAVRSSTWSCWMRCAGAACATATPCTSCPLFVIRWPVTVCGVAARPGRAFRTGEDGVIEDDGTVGESNRVQTVDSEDSACALNRALATIAHAVHGR